MSVQIDLETVLFYIISTWIILSAVGVVRSRSAVYSVLWLVSSMCGTAGLFVLLKAYLIAAIQVLVYAGAILVLFLFVVMLLDLRQTDDPKPRFNLSRFTALIIGILFFIETTLVIRTLKPSVLNAPEGTAQAIGRLLFSRFILPFELTSLLLLAAVISIVVLAKKEA